MKKFFYILICFITLLLTLPHTSYGANSDNFILTRDVVGGSGVDNSTSTNYQMSATAGQGAVGHVFGPNGHFVAGFWNTDTLSIKPPTGSIVINSDDTYTPSAGVDISHTSNDSDGVVTAMIISEDGVFDTESWVSYASLSSLTLSGADGTNTVYVKYKDNDGLVSFIQEDSIGLDTTAPTNGSINLTAQNSEVVLSWSGFTDEVSGVSSYRLVYSDAGTPVDCASGTTLYTGSGTGYTQTHLLNGATYNYRVCATDAVGHQSAGVTNLAVPATTTTGISFPSYDVGLMGIERDSGESPDNNNIDEATGFAKADTLFDFFIVLKDPSGLTPQSVELFLSQRTTPVDPADYTGLPMVCTGAIESGATCNYSTELGPASTHKYYFKAVLNDGTVIRYPSTGSSTGPEVALLTGYNIVGVPRTINTLSLDGSGAFNSVATSRWISEGLSTVNGGNIGSYETVDATVAMTNPISEGEGYFVFKGLSTTLPNMDAITDVTEPAYTVVLKPGWNMVSNPYSGNVLLSSLEITKDSGTPIQWPDAVDNGVVINSIYQYDGSDWGKTYSFKTAGGGNEARLVPWVGYWMYLQKQDGNYSLVINKP